jgi:cyclopropane fatty-acyl-phospholipid synthase-like methyltransferase
MSAADKLEILKAVWTRSTGRSREDLVEDALFEEDRQRFMLILGGHIFFQTLSAAVRFDLFTRLSERGPLPRPQVAAQLGIADKAARILLLGCTALGLVRKTDSGYANTPLSELFLTRGSPKNVLSFVELEHHVIYKPMHSFYDALKANANVGLHEFKGGEATLYQRLAHYPDLEQIFQDAMEDLSVQANATFAQFVDVSHVKHLVDVGGGNGANIIALARKYPALRATVFDSATVCQIARENIKAAGFADRLGAVAGNCFTDPFPAGADCLLFAHFFTIWSEEKDRSLLRKSFQALPSGGSVILFNMMQSDSEDGPLSAALGSPYFLTLATGEGMLYTWREYETWMKEAGFVNIRRQQLPTDHGAISGTKP